MTTPDARIDLATKLSGWQAFCAAARTMSASNDNAPTDNSKPQEDAHDAQRNN